ncbi:protein xmas-1 isoform X1 [Drosophila elegans]|uniref:protein xmas-1 isoform X1 n=1 Tax=Drosophila elegans TaxID=30023 RepID=UPI0007E64D23|nr:protein xmas-1 isoform X1 [Drosophila elegans]
MKSIVAQTENQLRPLKMSRIISVMKGSRRESQSLGTSSSVCKVVAQLKGGGGGQVEFRWMSHLASLLSRPATNTLCTNARLLRRPYVSFNTRLTRKLSGAMERRGSSFNFLGRWQSRRGLHSSSCILPVKTRHAPKTVQGRMWPIWRQSSVRPLLLPSSNLWTGVLSQRFYVPRLRPADEEEEEGVERRAVPRLRVTREESEEEEAQLQRRRDGSRLRHPPAGNPLVERPEEGHSRGQEQGDRQPYVPSVLMTPQLATKWLTTQGKEHQEHREHREHREPTARMTSQVWVSGSQRRYRRSERTHRPITSELEGWRRSAHHQPVPIFQGQPAEQEHLRHASCRTSARSMRDIQQSSQMVWETKKQTPWSRAREESVDKPGHGTGPGPMMVQESRSKQHRLITKELVYRAKDLPPKERGDGGGRGGKAMSKSSPERALIRQHLADLLPVAQKPSSFRIGYQRHAPTRQLLEQGKCHVSVRRVQFLHLQPVRSPNSIIQSADLEARETLHRKDGAKRPCAVHTVVKPSLLTLIRGHGRRLVAKRSSSVGVRPQRDVSVRRLVRNASSLEVLCQASAKLKPKSLVNEYHKDHPIKKLPQVSSKLAHPFKDFEEARIKEKEVASSWKQAHVARNYKYEASTSYRNSNSKYPGKKSTTKDMTEAYFLAKRSSSAAPREEQRVTSSSKRVKPPRQPAISPKVQVPEVHSKQRSQEKLWS